MRRVAVGTLTALCALLLAVPAGATPPRVTVLKPVSPPNPFPNGCGYGGIMFDSEFEPTLAVDPSDRRNLAVAWMQGGGSQGGSVGVAGAWTRDGGRRWTGVAFPGTNACTGADDWPGSGDPWLSFGSDGTAYFGSLLGRRGEVPDDPLNVFTFNTRLQVNRSTDGGRTWSDPVVVPQPLVPEDRYADREILTAHPREPGRAYLMWTLSDDPLGPRGTYFSRTTDGGRTWSKAELALRTGSVGSYSMNGLLVLPDDSLLAVLRQFVEGGARPIVASRSTDEGRSWSRPVQLSDEHRRYTTSDPDTGSVKVDAGSNATAALAPDGSVYVVWQDNESVDRSALVLSRSVDFGRTWSVPRPIVTCACQAFKPLVVVADDGTVGMVYHDDRRDRSGDSEWTADAWFTHSHDGGERWKETHVGGPFDYRQPPGEESQEARHVYAAGDYANAVAVPGGIAAAFLLGRGQAREGSGDIFFARIRTAPRRHRLSVSVRPARARAGLPTRFRFRVLARRRPVRGATVRFAGRRVRTGRAGRGRMVAVLPRSGRYRVVATKRGFRRGVARVRATQAR